ncbi:putative toxin-antitoxin system toxin component, PIN family [Candidatus Daviesbacteria bacterium]|nr:putative toxin-antitoxin system toxin component, PIN family [Candidatus Daviesbacteria bacterium]
MRIVLDTNIYIAAALRNSFSEDIVNIIRTTDSLTAITSEAILLELEQKLQVKFNWHQEDINRLLSKIRKIAEVVRVKEKISVVTRDPKDNKIIECALASKADLIVTLDQDLIKLKHFKGVAIIHPKTFSWIFPEYFNKTKAN